MKKTLTGIIFLILLALLIGCAQTSGENTESKEQEFKDRLMESSWEVDIMGVSGTVTFKENTGVAKIDSYGEHDFDYTVSNVSDDGKSATVKITNSGIEQIDGQSANATFVDDGLEVSSFGMSYTLRPVEN